MLVRAMVGVLVALATLAVAFFLSLRTRFSPVMDNIRRMNKRFINPRTMSSAGQRGAWASVVRHIGRSTGNDYETPIVAEPTGDGFIIALPYGTRADWVQNVLAAGFATIVRDGLAHDVDRPVVLIGEEGNAYFPPGEQRQHRLFGLDHFLVVHHRAQE